MSGFKTAQRFETEVAERKLRPAYVLIGDEAFFRKRCREAILKYLAPIISKFLLRRTGQVRNNPTMSSPRKLEMSI